LFDRSLASSAHTAASDAELLFNVLSHADTGALIDRKCIFINCTHETLAAGHLDLIQPDRVVLEMPPLPGAAVDEIEARSQTLSGITKRGFRLAFDDTVLTQPYASWLPHALLHGTGVLTPFLELTKACENADDKVFAKTTAFLHLSNQQVNWAHLQALAWAETLAD
jgi:c-di-GMP-related signal transduction protein